MSTTTIVCGILVGKDEYTADLTSLDTLGEDASKGTAG
jgi:hypothetical protein